MDIFSHFLWTFIIFNKYEYLKFALLFGILPDILSWGIYMSYALINKIPFGKPNINLVPKWVFTLYGITHSLFVFVFVFVLLFFIFKEIPIYLLAWLVHIMIDIPTHTRTFLPTPFLWPFSKWTFPGISWGNMRFTIVNYLVIVISFIIIYIERIFLFFRS